jgi:hypothetical protein
VRRSLRPLIQLTNAAGSVKGSASIAVTALTLDGNPFATTDGTEPFAFSTAGKKYVLTISTSGLPVGTHVVTYHAGADPTTHTVTFTTQ